MHALYSLEQVLGNERGGFFGQILVLGDNVVELPVAAQFQQRVEVSFVMEETEDIDDVGVVEKRLDLELADELFEDVVLHDFSLL